jgi:precorrin-6B methylase 2
MDTVEGKSLGRNALLRRAPEIEVRLRDNEVEVRGKHGKVECGFLGLAILEALEQARTMDEVLSLLQGRAQTPLEWVQLSALVMEFLEAGVVETDADQPILKSDFVGYSSAWVHIRMLEDVARTGAYLEAIRQVVCPGDVVVDLGTGTGVLAVAAAKAGARRVYAIEATDIADVAQRVFEANECADRITLVRGWSTRVELPERGDVMVSELVGDEALREEILEYTRDALARHLKPGAAMVPRGLTVRAIPVTVDEQETRKHFFHESQIGEWSSRYGVDFGPLLEARPPGLYSWAVKLSVARHWPALGAPVALATVDLTSAPAELNEVRTIEVEEGGRLDGFLTYFDLDLAEGIGLSTRPETAEESCHWRAIVWLLPRSLSVRPGQSISICYRHSAVRTILELTDT